MTKFITFYLILTQILASNAWAGLPAPTAKGQDDAAAIATFNLQVPASQSTRINGTTALIETGNQNRLKNPGFEGGVTSWSASGGSFSPETNPVNVGSGKTSGAWDSSAASQTLTNSAGVAVFNGDGLSGQNGAASCRIKAATGTATHKLQAYDGTNVLGEVAITSNTARFERSTVNFSFPASGTVYLRLVSVASDEPAIYLDGCYLGLGEGFNLSTYGGQITEWQSYTPVITTASGSIANVTTSAIKGKYRRVGDTAECEVSIPFNATAKTAWSQLYVTAPGTVDVSKFATVNAALISVGLGRDAGVANYEMMARYLVSTGKIEILSANKNGATNSTVYDPISDVAPFTWGDQDEIIVRFTVPIQGWTAETAIRTSQVFDPTGMILPFGGSTCPANTLPTDGSAVSRTTYAKLFNKISTSFGTGDGSTTFNVPDTRGIFLRGQGSQTINSIVYSGTLGTKQGDQLQGHKHSLSVSNSGTAGAPAKGDGGGSLSADGWVGSPITDGTNGTPRTGTETRPANLAVNYCIVTDGSAFFPQLVGSVTSNTSGQERVERLRFGGASNGTNCTSSPCTLLSQSGAWVGTVVRNSTGNYSVNFAAGMFNAAPTCTANGTLWGTGPAIVGIDSPSTSGVVVSTRATSNAPTDGEVFMTCIGPR